MNDTKWHLGRWHFLLIPVGSQLCQGHRDRKRRESCKDLAWPNYGMQQDRISLEMKTLKCLKRSKKHCPRLPILKPFQNQKQDKNLHLGSAGTGNTRTHCISSLQHHRVFIPVLTDPSCVVKSLEQPFFFTVFSTIKFHWRLLSAQQFQTVLKVLLAVI